MPAQRTRNPTEKEWLAQKPRLKKLWLEEGKTMAVVTKLMETEYNFHATKSEYVRHFNKEWNWSKYHKKQDWEHITLVMHDRQRQGKKTEVLISGELQSDQKIRKETARFGRLDAQTISATSITEIPHGITIRTPPLDMTASLTYRLPFYEFENNLRLSYNPISLPSPPRGYIVEDQAVDGDIDESFTSSHKVVALERQLGGKYNSTNYAVANAWTPGTSVLSALKSVVAQPMVDETLYGSPLTHLNIQVFTSPIHRQIFCSLANNSAGLDRLPVQDMIQFLQKESDEKLYRVAQFARGYTARAIIQSIFKAAVEAGDARVVDILVRENSADIKINEQSCVVDGERYTPLERATILRHEELVEVFLNHGAKVNRTYADDRVGALDLAVIVSSRLEWNAQPIPFHSRIFRKLLESGGDLCDSAMKRLVHGNSESTVLIMSKHARKNAAQWCRWGVFCEAMIFLDDQSSMKIIDIMLECSVDLNHDVSTLGNATIVGYSYRVIDIAAHRGQLPAVERLLKSGASLTGNTLPCAVKSQNKDLIRLLLESGADINSIGRLNITTLSVAYELGDDEMIRFLEERGASVINQSKEHCSAAVLAASKRGSIKHLERLARLGVRVSPQDLGYALRLAILDDRDQDVEKLTDAGFIVNNERLRDSMGGRSLQKVLERRKESLTFLLLNADADPNDNQQFYPSSIQLAVEWGNRSVIEALIFAGVDVDCCDHQYKGLTALATAVKRRDRGLIELLLASGASINSGLEKPNITNPLEAAAENGDIDMARYLIDHGADPNNSRALEKSYVKNQELFDLLCQTYHARYPSLRGVFGIRLLMHAIENGNHDAIKKMLQSGVNAEAMTQWNFSRGDTCFLNPYDNLKKDHLEVTGLGYAIVRQKENTTKFMLQYGCDPNGIVLEDHGMIQSKQSKWSRSRPSREPAIVAAIRTRRRSMVELLINHRAKVNLPTFGPRPVRRTPLQKASELGDIEMVTLLINHGADVNAPAAYAGGGTSLQLAAIGGYIPVAIKLLSHKADVNAPGAKVYGRTALEGAAEHGRLDMIKILLNAWPGSRRVDEGQVATAMALARENGFFYICDYLESHLHGWQGQDSGPEMLLDGTDGECNLDKDLFPC